MIRSIARVSRACSARCPIAQTLAGIVLVACLGGRALADEAVFSDTRADMAVAEYGVTGKGVIVAILDRGIDYTHPDFIKPDGNTRIKWLLDMTGENLCQSGPAPVEYSEDQINAALHGAAPLNTRDAVGHGTVTAGVAAGNGRAAAGGKYRGLAPDADLIIIKMTSEGVPAHNGVPAEAPFQACLDQALDWLDQKVAALGEPCVALINSGTQWGPMDGTSAVSRKIDAMFGLDRPGRVYVSASGDEGALPNHARVSYSDATDGVVPFAKPSPSPAYLCLWYTGTQPASVTLSFDGGPSCGPVAPGAALTQNGISIYQYAPGQAFYPWQSSGPDRAVWVYVPAQTGTGTITFRGASPGTGTADLYGPIDTSAFSYTSDLTPGRLNDYSTTASAVVMGCHVVRDAWVDVDGVPRSFTTEGSMGMLWTHSAGGPTRDGRHPGVDITAPGQNTFAAYARDAWWTTFRFNLVQDGGGWYGRHSATSAAAPIGVGAVALMLQMNPRLTARQVKEILHTTARADAFTGAVPNDEWGYGKLDVLGALDAVQASLPMTQEDARRALRIAAGLQSATPTDLARLDLDHSGAVDMPEAASLLRKAEGL